MEAEKEEQKPFEGKPLPGKSLQNPHTEKRARWHKFGISTLTQKFDHQLFKIHIWLKSTEVSQTSADHTVFSCRGFKVFSANKDIQKIKSQPRAFPLLLLFACLRAQHTEQTQPFAGSC